MKSRILLQDVQRPKCDYDGTFSLLAKILSPYLHAFIPFGDFPYCFMHAYNKVLAAL